MQEPRVSSRAAVRVLPHITPPPPELPVAEWVRVPGGLVRHLRDRLESLWTLGAIGGDQLASDLRALHYLVHELDVAERRAWYGEQAPTEPPPGPGVEGRLWITDEGRAALALARAGEPA